MAYSWGPFKQEVVSPVDDDGAVGIPERLVVDVDQGSVVGVPDVDGPVLSGRDDVGAARRDAAGHLQQILLLRRLVGRLFQPCSYLPVSTRQTLFSYLKVQGSNLTRA